MRKKGDGMKQKTQTSPGRKDFTGFERPEPDVSMKKDKMVRVMDANGSNVEW